MQEPNPVFPLGATLQYSLIQCLQWLYRAQLPQITRTDCTANKPSKLLFCNMKITFQQAIKAEMLPVNPEKNNSCIFTDFASIQNRLWEIKHWLCFYLWIEIILKWMKLRLHFIKFSLWNSIIKVYYTIVPVSHM